MLSETLTNSTIQTHDGIHISANRRTRDDGFANHSSINSWP